MRFPLREASEPLNAPGTWQWDCAFAWNARFAFQVALTSIGNQAAVEGLRNQVSRQNTVLAGAIEYHQDMQRLSDARED